MKSTKQIFGSGLLALSLTCLVAGGCGSDQTIVGSVDASKTGDAATPPKPAAKAPAAAAGKFKGIGNKGNPE